MPKIMEPSKYIKTEHVKKREPGHEYRAHKAATTGSWQPGWYYFSYRPIKFGPFATQEEALNAGIEATVRKRATVNV